MSTRQSRGETRNEGNVVDGPFSATCCKDGVRIPGLKFRLFQQISLTLMTGKNWLKLAKGWAIRTLVSQSHGKVTYDIFLDTFVFFQYLYPL